jgi:hypothetical protein
MLVNCSRSRPMRLELEVWLRNNDFAVTDTVDVPIADPVAWTDEDVRILLGELLRAIDRAKHPGADRKRPVFLRGFNWIVSPFENRGVLVSLEIQLGAAAAGPFAVDQGQLEAMITRVVNQARAEASPPPARVH